MKIILEIVNKLYRRIFGDHISAAKMVNPHDKYEGTVSIYQEQIKELIDQGNPLMMARFGTIELSAYLNYLTIYDRLDEKYRWSAFKYVIDRCYPNWFSVKTKNGMCNNAGFFPPSDANLLRWGGLWIKTLRISMLSLNGRITKNI